MFFTRELKDVARKKCTDISKKDRVEMGQTRIETANVAIRQNPVQKHHPIWFVGVHQPHLRH